MVGKHRKHLGDGDDLNKQGRSSRNRKDDPAVLLEVANSQGKLTKLVASSVKADERDNEAKKKS